MKAKKTADKRAKPIEGIQHGKKTAARKQAIITPEKLRKYFTITQKAFSMAKSNVNKDRLKEAEEIILMVSCYVEDAHYFEKKEDYVNAFACLNYAHGWLDTGSRLGIFDVKDDALFVIK